MPQRITIKEIAKQAKVSIGTVDRVLHDRGRVAQVTKDKILEIAKKGNYSSNIYARNLKLNRTYQIAVILPDDNPYWNKHRLGIARGISEHAAMGLTQEEFIVSTSSEASRAAAIEEALANDPDGLILSPNMLSKDGRSAEMLNKTDVPYVFIDSTMEELNNLSFVGQESFQSGLMAGGILSKPYVNDYAVYVITLSESDTQNKVIGARIAGLESFYQDKGEVEIIKINLETDEKSMGLLKKLLLQTKKAAHVFIPSSKSHLVLKGLHDIRQQTKMRVLGYDLIDENVTCLKNDWLDFVIDQQPTKQGYLAVQALYKHLILKSETPKNQYLPIDIITKENLMYCDY